MAQVTSETAEIDASVDSSGLWSVVSERAHPLDVVLLAVVPVVLVAAFALPASTREGLALAYDDPALVPAVASHFVHLSVGHLLVNVGGYLLVVSTAYLLSIASGRRRQFLVAFTVFVVAFPLALSGLNLLFSRPSVGVGFSGIVLAFVGYLPVAIVGTAGSRLRVPLDRHRSEWLFCFGLAVVALVTAPSMVGAGIAAAAGLAGVLFLLPVLDDWTPVHVRRLRRSVARTDTLELLLLGAVVYVGYLFVAFPADLSRGATVVNVYSHVLGYTLGFVTTHLAVVTGVLDVD